MNNGTRPFDFFLCPPDPLHKLVPTSGSSLHLPLMQISWPEQSPRLLHGPVQLEMNPVGGEVGTNPPVHISVPTSGSSLHFALMQVSWPEQSSWVVHVPLQSDTAFVKSGQVVVTRNIRYRNTWLAILGVIFV